MDCASCADDVKRSLGQLEGIEDVGVDVVGGKVRVAYAEGKLARGDIAGAIRRVGYRVEDGETRRAGFLVEGMDCADEVRQLERALGRLPGVANLSFDLVRRRMVVEGTVTTAELERAVNTTGMTARPGAKSGGRSPSGIAAADSRPASASNGSGHSAGSRSRCSPRRRSPASGSARPRAGALPAAARSI